MRYTLEQCGMVFLALMLAACGESLVFEPVVTEQITGTDALIIGISPVDDSTVWIAGTGGTYGRTLDGGAHWTIGVVPGADTLQFRDVYAVDKHTAYLLSIGPGASSRIYKTVDGGTQWTLQFVNEEQAGFFDCMDFWDADHGMAFSDSFDGAFYIITTSNGGDSWVRVPPDRLPPARPGEGSFAASGHCLHAYGDSAAWIGTGAHEEGPARVLRTTDRGRHWTSHDTPIPGGPVRGLTSVAFVTASVGAALGGDVMDMESEEASVVLTTDGGRTWTLAGRPGFPGPVYGAVYVPGAPVPTLVAVGPEGLGVTTDQGATWQTLSSENLWTVGFAGFGAGWAAGRDGRVLHLSLYR